MPNTKEKGEGSNTVNLRPLKILSTEPVRKLANLSESTLEINQKKTAIQRVFTQEKQLNLSKNRSLMAF